MDSAPEAKGNMSKQFEDEFKREFNMNSHAFVSILSNPPYESIHNEMQRLSSIDLFFD